MNSITMIDLYFCRRHIKSNINGKSKRWRVYIHRYFVLLKRRKQSFNQQGGDSKALTSTDQPSFPFVDIWFRTDITMVMYLSNGTLQVFMLNLFGFLNITKISKRRRGGHNRTRLVMASFSASLNRGQKRTVWNIASHFWHYSSWQRAGRLSHKDQCGTQPNSTSAMIDS